MISFRKDVSESFFEGLSVKDFQCKCKSPECKIVNMDDKLFNALVKLKMELKLKVVPCLSGNRCEAHNTKVGGEIKSRHLISVGQAIDIPESIFKDPEDAAKLLYKCGFTFVKYYQSKKFFHADVRDQH